MLIVGFELPIIPIVLTIMAVMKLYHMWKRSYDNTNDQNYLLQPWNKRTCKCDMIIGAVMIAMATIAVGLFLIANNDNPLDCSIKDKNTNLAIRLIFLSISLAVLIFILLSYCLRRRCSCVDVKGDLVEVNILSSENDKFELVFQEGDNHVTIVKHKDKVYIKNDEPELAGESRGREQSSEGPNQTAQLSDTICLELERLDQDLELELSRHHYKVDWNEKHLLAYREEVEKKREGLASENYAKVEAVSVA